MFKTEFIQGCMLVLGGARSGKSSLSLNYCNDMKGRHIFIATAQAWDNEMEDRIRRHKLERGENWETIEESLEIVSAIQAVDSDDAVILLDCLTLWLSNLYMKYEEETGRVYEKIDEFAKALETIKGRLVLVSNEVGMGIVPENKLAREYRDAAGYMNRRIGEKARKVLVTFSGFPVVLKDGR